MKIKTEIEKLKSIDIYSFMLFALYKIKDIPEYSALSELAYVLDKDSLLKLCEYFGGVTLKIPTVEELESIVYALVLYQKVDMDKIPFEKAIKIINGSAESIKAVKLAYVQIKDILSNYELTERAKEWQLFMMFLQKLLMT